MSASAAIPVLGVGIDTARHGHRVQFMRPDRQRAAPPLTILENAAGYENLRQRLAELHQQHPQARFNIRLDAAGQYANNLERFLRQLPWPMTLSIGEPKRNKDYHKAHFPKRTSDDTESTAMARFAVVEQPPATQAVPEAFGQLQEIAGRLQSQVKQSTRAINRLHNLLARVFPELSSLAPDFGAGWVLRLLSDYPSADKIGRARLESLKQIPYLPKKRAAAIHVAAQNSVGSLRGGSLANGKWWIDILVAGLDYPWPAVAERAADAIARLGRSDLVPRLREVLAKPDPRSPQVRVVAGRKVHLVRELVRIHHDENCLLCHAPGTPASNPPPADERLTKEIWMPTYSSVYVRNPDLRIRFDVVYLRQDFSVNLPFGNATVHDGDYEGPELKRFDFLVRTRQINDKEAAVVRQLVLAEETQGRSPYHRAARSALRELTGFDQ